MQAPSPALLRLLRLSALDGVGCRMGVPTCSRKTRFDSGASSFPIRKLSTTTRCSLPDARTPNLAPKSRDRGPASKEDTQTDFGMMNVLGNTPPPATAIDACLTDGFHLSNGVKVTGGSGCILVGGEVFNWRPWGESAADGGQELQHMMNKKGQWEVSKSAWGLLELVWPKPELLILGVGGGLHPLSLETKRHINDLGVRVDVLDTRNASAQFNLLATERGVGNVAAALLPIGCKL